MHDEQAHHAHRHLHHLVGMRVVHEGPAVLQLEFVDEGLARRDVRLVQSADAVHAVRHDHAVPMNGGVLGQSIGDEDANLVALDRFEGRTRRLAVVAPQMGRHTVGDLTHHRLGHKMKFLPVAVHPPRQRPSVERHDGLIVRTACGMERRLHHGLVHRRRFRNAGGLCAPAHRARADQRGAAEKSPA